MKIIFRCTQTFEIEKNNSKNGKEMHKKDTKILFGC